MHQSIKGDLLEYRRRHNGILPRIALVHPFRGAIVNECVVLVGWGVVFVVIGGGGGGSSSANDVTTLVDDTMPPSSAAPPLLLPSPVPNHIPILQPTSTKTTAPNAIPHDFHGSMRWWWWW